MTRRSSAAAVLAALALCFALGHHSGAQQPTGSPDLSGEWNCAGWNMGVDPAKEPSYRGTVTMERREKDTYVVQWKMGERVVNRGVGLYDPRTGVFAAGYAINNQPGVAVWKLSENRRTMDCRGTFQGQLGDVAHESWTRP